MPFVFLVVSDRTPIESGAGYIMSTFPTVFGVFDELQVARDEKAKALVSMPDHINVRILRCEEVD